MDLFLTIIQILTLLFSVVLHEVAHGAMAEKLGDKTARSAGRITLNPLKHLDPIGSIAVPLFLFLSKSGFIFGWAKPVPVNPYNLTDKKYGQAKVSLAGPLSNLGVALFFGLLLRFVHIEAAWFQSVSVVFVYIVLINIVLALFNLTPLPPFDGSHILFAFLPKSLLHIQETIERFSIFALLIYIFFIFPLLYPLVGKVFYLITGLVV